MYLRSDALRRRGIALWEALGPENNRVLRAWGREGVMARTAAESQGLLELRQQYCEEKKCLECAIGKGLLGEDSWPPMELGEEAWTDWNGTDEDEPLW